MPQAPVRLTGENREYSSHPRDLYVRATSPSFPNAMQVRLIRGGTALGASIGAVAGRDGAAKRRHVGCARALRCRY